MKYVCVAFLGLLFTVACLVTLWPAAPSAQGRVNGVTNASVTALENLTGDGTDMPAQFTTHWWLQQIESAIDTISFSGPAESSVFSDGAALTPIGLERRDTPGPGTAVINGDIGTPGMSAYGGIYTQLLTDAGAIATFATDGTHGQTVVTTGPHTMSEAKNYDGAALPNTVTEGQSVRAAATLSGVQYVMVTSQNGAVDRFAGCTPGSSISTAAVMETEIKATAGTLHSLRVYSLDATPVYAKLYNDTAANTDQTDTPLQRDMVPANSTAALGSGFVIPIPDGGINFSTAITIRVTTGIADSDTGALTANEVLMTYCYK